MDAPDPTPTAADVAAAVGRLGPVLDETTAAGIADLLAGLLPTVRRAANALPPEAESADWAAAMVRIAGSRR